MDGGGAAEGEVGGAVDDVARDGQARGLVAAGAVQDLLVVLEYMLAFDGLG